MRTKLLKAVPLLVAAVAGAAVMRLCSSASPSIGAKSAAATAVEAPAPGDVAPGAKRSPAASSGTQPALLVDHGRSGSPCDPADPRCTPVERPLLVRVDQPTPAPAPAVAAATTSSGDAPGRDISADLRQLSDAGDQVRIAAAQALSASHDPRVVTALAMVLSKDDEPAVRREAALALGKVLDERTPNDVREVGLGALARAAASDSDLEVCVTADRVLAGLPHGTPHARASAR